MSLLSPFVGGVVGVVVRAAVVFVSIAGVGVGHAHAQDCDPVEVAELFIDDGMGGESFGGAVSLSGDTVVIGAIFDGDNGSNSGSASIFVRSGGVWTEEAKLLAGDGETSDYFGRSVSICGDTAIIGAYGDDDNGDRSGSAYVFTRSGGGGGGGVWTQQAKLLPADGSRKDNFGISVSVNGDTAIVGAWYTDHNGTDSGSVYVFTRNEDVWTEQATLLPADGTAGAVFGWAAALMGDTVLVGARGGRNNGIISGSAYIFTRSGGVWSEQAKLLPGDGEAGDGFGHAVSLSGDTALIGTKGDDDNGTDSGSAYVFTRSGGVWTEQAKLLPDDGGTDDKFGNSVSISGDTAVIGAYEDDESDEDSGSAYVFTRSGGGGGVWSQQAKLLPDDGAGGDQFGWFVSISDDTAAIGAAGDDDSNYDAGSAYIFDLGCDDCPADLTGDGIVDTRDFIAFLGAWASGDPLADWNGDGTVNTLDFLAYLADWTAGC